MAARLEPAPMRPPDLIDLRRLAARDIERLLVEEIQSWRRELDWEFDKSADLVRRFVDLRALSGYALLDEGQIAGYLYYVLEDGKGLIGDLYVRNAWRTVEAENRLLENALSAIMGNRTIPRIESQLMMLRHTAERTMPRADCLNTFERNFMRIDLVRAPLADGRVRRPMYMEKWSDHYQD